MVLLVLLVVLFLLLVIPLGWLTALRMSLVRMFFLNASAHRGRRRADLIRMVPSGFPQPDLVVTLTGDCKILGAIGLMMTQFTRPAAIGLALLLIGMFPAKIHAARQGMTTGDKPATPLVARSVIQGVILIATMAVAVGSNGQVRKYAGPGRVVVKAVLT